MVFIGQWLSSVSGLHRIFGLRYISLPNGSWVFTTQVTFIRQLVFSDFGLMAFRFHKYWPSHWGLLFSATVTDALHEPSNSINYQPLAGIKSLIPLTLTLCIFFAGCIV
jgi:hypothetical protein